MSIPEVRFIEGKRDSDGMCEAARPVYLVGTRTWELFCSNQATETWQYGCLHEHVKVRRTCAEHRPEPGAVGCRECFEQDHYCDMIARQVTE